MLPTIVLSVAVLLVLSAAMAVGVILANKPIKGSCGGLAALGMKEGCDICGGDRGKCEENSRNGGSARAAELGRDALRR
ncbi:(Na+)-NQR maturation NqrM [Isoalcanivorax beigongshangi]|uniref:(Na+)-NQR maturation NqrM n=1 Tax=Isoalcanivorax beigongshangi TaxID=3238810 RepID=A0ABV4AH03_9GAMM